MKESSKKLAMGLVCLGIAAIVIALAAHGLLAGQAPAAGKSSAEPIPALTPYVEVHTHFDEKDINATIQSGLAALGRQNARMIFFQMLPDTYDHPGHYDAEVILDAAKKYPNKFAVLGGGGTLNAMIQESVKTGDAGPAVQKKFKDRAEELLREGVVGFGEMSAEHFIIGNGTPYQYAPADHPLFLILDDIAAQNRVPIDIHMEAVPAPMKLPADLKSPPNAPELHENITAFERLLAHNRRASIIWAHAGSDGTGFRTPDLCRRLLKANPNLYLEIKADPGSHGLNYPLENGKIKPDWLKLFQDFPNQFIIGTDQHYPERGVGQERWQEAVLLLNQLPLDLRRKIGTENVAHIFGKVTALSASAAKN